MFTHFKYSIQALKEIGIKEYLKKLYYYSEVKSGKFVGTDQWGNKYFENLDYMFGKDRWVEPNIKVGIEATNIPPEWHSWIHHETDLTGPEIIEKFAPKYKEMHTPNLTGTEKAYLPKGYLFSNDHSSLEKKNIQKFDEIPNRWD